MCTCSRIEASFRVSQSTIGLHPQWFLLFTRQRFNWVYISSLSLLRTLFLISVPDFQLHRHFFAVARPSGRGQYNHFLFVCVLGLLGPDILACSRCSDSPLPQSSLAFFPLFRSLSFSLALHYLNAWNRLQTSSFRSAKDIFVASFATH